VTGNIWQALPGAAAAGRADLCRMTEPGVSHMSDHELLVGSAAAPHAPPCPPPPPPAWPTSPKPV
jgi:hypothetical protein